MTNNQTTPAPDAAKLPEEVALALVAVCRNERDYDFAAAKIAAALAEERDPYRDMWEESEELSEERRRVGAEYRDRAEAAEARCEWIAAALRGDPIIGAGSAEPLVRDAYALRDRATTAEARVRELEADAARLNFVQREGLRCGAWYSDDGEGVVICYFCETPETGDEARGPTLRAAIDAARQAGEVEDD